MTKKWIASTKILISKVGEDRETNPHQDHDDAAMVDYFPKPMKTFNVLSWLGYVFDCECLLTSSVKLLRFVT